MIIIVIIIKRISRVPIYCTWWDHRVLYNNTHHTDRHRQTHRQKDTHTTRKFHTKNDN